MHVSRCRSLGKSSGDIRNVVVDYLHKAVVATIRLEVEGLCLDTCLLDELPLQVFLLELRVGGVASVFTHGVDGLGAVLGFLGTGDIGQPA